MEQSLDTTWSQSSAFYCLGITLSASTAMHICNSYGVASFPKRLLLKEASIIMLRTLFCTFVSMACFLSLVLLFGEQAFSRWRQYCPVLADQSPPNLAHNARSFLRRSYHRSSNRTGGSVPPSVILDGVHLTVYGGLVNMAVQTLKDLIFEDCVHRPDMDKYPVNDGWVHISCNHCDLAKSLTLKQLTRVLEIHGITYHQKAKKQSLQSLLTKHVCVSCEPIFFVFRGRKPPPNKCQDFGPPSNAVLSTECAQLLEKGFKYVTSVTQDGLAWYDTANGFFRCKLNSMDSLAILEIGNAFDVRSNNLKATSTHSADQSSAEIFSIFLTPTISYDDGHASQTLSYTDQDRIFEGPTTRSHKLVDYGLPENMNLYSSQPGYEIVNISLRDLDRFLNLKSAHKVTRLHQVRSDSRQSTRRELSRMLAEHVCITCPPFVAVFKPASVKFIPVNLVDNHETLPIDTVPETLAPCNPDPTSPCITTFPPRVPDKAFTENVIRAFCDSMSPGSVQESGCAVCGQLVPVKSLSPLKAMSKYLHVLSGTMPIERKTHNAPRWSSDVPVIDKSCTSICDSCRSSLRNLRVPRFALCRGLWLGDVPPELQGLRTIEKMLISKVQHNYCVATVASGHRKLKCNVVCFEMPVDKVYDVLPPPIEDLDEVLAVIFSGPTVPTEKEFARTPFLVRRQKVRKALEWLKLNHSEYASIGISNENLSSYPEDIPPVSVVYKAKEGNKNNVSISAFDNEDEDGVESGPCPFVVHGLTGEHLSNLTGSEMKGLAISHWDAGKGALRVGQSDTPEKTYKNPSLYPSLFPWLFPYGVGGIGSIQRLSPSVHKQRLLMYHDKRFQLDEYFCFVSFNHEQYDETSKNGYLLVDKPVFKSITDRLLTLDRGVLAQLATRMADGESISSFTVKTPEEKACFSLINDLDYVSGRSYGSLSSKKWMRNELWSLIAFRGAPLWYITINPVDNKHPLCMYYAGSELAYNPQVTLPYEDRVHLAAKNPVACARFFDFMVSNFIKHVIGCNDSSPGGGIYGKPSAYYGVVEQQGRLSLHLHLLLWITGGSNPDDVRNQLKDPASTFSKDMVAYLESVNKGEFHKGDMNSVAALISQERLKGTFQDPIVVQPVPPPIQCKDACEGCVACKSNAEWWNHYYKTTDKIVYLSNRHVCRTSYTKNGRWNRKFDAPGCLDTPSKKCKRRFPRKYHKHTSIDIETGSIELKHREPWLNRYTPLLSYLTTCNTDTTSLRSGTAIKAVLLYVLNYVTKVALKTYVIFDVLKSVFEKADTLLRASRTASDKAWTLLVKMVNSLSSRLKIGSPMAALYLLRGSDRYTDHEFTPFYWQGFVHEAAISSGLDDDMHKELQHEKAPIVARDGKLTHRSRVNDYILRGDELEDMCLHEWISRCTTEKIPDGEKHDGNPSSGRKGLSDQQITHHRLWATSRRVNMNEKHPDSGKYRTLCVPFSRRKVPNFIGRSIPRKDRGDRNYYCLTMLAFLKPWRSGADLLNNHATWQEAFEESVFSDDQQELMKNFSVRYECLDAKDDYFAQMKQDEADTEPVFPLDDEDDSIEELLTSNLSNEHASGLHELFVEPDIHLESGSDLGDRGIKDIARSVGMEKMRSMLDEVGWSTVQPNLAEHTKKKDAIAQFNKHSSICMSATEWRKRLATARQGEIELRIKSCRQVSGKRVTKQPKNRRVFKGVDVVDKSFMHKLQTGEGIKESKHIDLVAVDEELNEEQERAFRIIARHATMPGAYQLRMYIGGVGGTGKSTVIKAVQRFFLDRQESYRSIVVAPTGNAASLVGGSTYHHMFGLGPNRRMGSKLLSAVRDRLRDVDYIIVDEVSMLSCRDLDKIHQRLCEVSGNRLLPFGGFGIIFCGDFAQLPPVAGHAKMALYSRRAGFDGSRLRNQEAACGKALWMQVYLVVILRKNMRQTLASDDDKRLRRALENMRYRSCDALDIAFLRSKRHMTRTDRSSNAFLAKFRGVSVITARHLDIDVLNQVGCRRLASETGKEIVRFYSDDELPIDEETGTSTAWASKASSKARVRTDVTDDMTHIWEALWNQPPNANDEKIPGHIDVFEGMPVLIQNNSATELSVTRGQEAIVRGWLEGRGRFDQRVLEVLFVELVDPLNPVMIPGLPENVVPLTRVKTAITVTLPDDTIIRVSRSQIEAVPNFGMTDYQSQGKTRTHNVVHLKNLRDQFSYYTALSRGTSADDTLIIGDFDVTKITSAENRKMDRSLKQEFRELELLDEVTRLRYHRSLPKTFCDSFDRVSLILAYRSHKGPDYVPKSLHPAVAWSQNDPFLEFTHTEVEWCKIGKSGTNALGEQMAPESQISPKSTTNTKRKRSQSPSSPRKQCKHESYNVAPQRNALTEERMFVPRGVRWRDNSCAYDSVFTILRNAWFDTRCPSQVHLVSSLRTLNPTYGEFISNMEPGPYDDARDRLRRRLEADRPDYFVYGRYASVGDILDTMFQTSNVITEQNNRCPRCGASRNYGRRRNTHSIILPSATTGHATLEDIINGDVGASNGHCEQCGEEWYLYSKVVSAPPILTFGLSGLNVDIGLQMTVRLDEDHSAVYVLKGATYFQPDHFVSRFRDSTGAVWFHDGLITGHAMEYDPMNAQFDWSRRGEARIEACLYTRIG